MGQEVAFEHVGSRIRRQNFYFLRCGVVLVSFLTMCVLLTLYRQIWTAAEIFSEIRQRQHSILAYNNMGTGANHWTKDLPAYKPGNNGKFMKNSEDNAKFVPRNAHFMRAFKSRIQEHFYAIRRFYEAHQDSKLDRADSAPSFQTTPTPEMSLNSVTGYDERLRASRKIHAANPHLRKSNLRDARFARVINLRGTQVENSNISRGTRVVNSYVLRGTRVVSPRVSRGTPTNVMILAYHRSGSSFLGEMFNQNPEVFYLFEPLHSVQVYLGNNFKSPLLYDTLVRHILDTIYTCSFNKHPLFVNTLTSSGFRLKSRSLSSPRFCDPRVTSQKMHLCRRINATLLTHFCRSSPHTVVKTIRVTNWENLEFLTEPDPYSKDIAPPLKVIYLVRDPRAIITSRVSWILSRNPKIWQENVTNHDNNATATKNAMAKYIRIVSAGLCDQMYRDINSWRKKTKLGKMYAMIRYEDAAERPLDAYEEIYEFAGIAKSDHVRNWLDRNTQADWNQEYYSTSRNSSAAAQKWRLRFPMTLVTEVQEQCSEVMRNLGYRLVDSETELRNMSRSLVNKWDNVGLLRTN